MNCCVDTVLSRGCEGCKMGRVVVVKPCRRLKSCTHPADAVNVAEEVLERVACVVWVSATCCCCLAACSRSAYLRMWLSCVGFRFRRSSNCSSSICSSVCVSMCR